MTEIRSYRRVFDLERRIYTIERVRLNPSGVPVRGVLYLLAAVGGSLFAARLPVLGTPLRLMPWFLRDLGLPAAAAAALTVIRIDGRTFHQAASAAVAFWTAPRRIVGLGRPARSGGRWHPPDVLFMPDGSDPAPRRFRYTGPGTAIVLVPHRSEALAVRRLRREPRRTIRVVAGPSPARLRRGRVITLDRRTSLLVDVSLRDYR